MPVNQDNERRIVIVDDSDVAATLHTVVLANLMDTCFSEINVKNRVYEDPQVALAKLTSDKRSDVLVLDLNMPEMSGYELLQALIEQDHEIGLLVISTGSISPNETSPLKRKVEALIASIPTGTKPEKVEVHAKPLNMSRLAASIRAALLSEEEEETLDWPE